MMVPYFCLFIYKEIIINANYTFLFKIICKKQICQEDKFEFGIKNVFEIPIQFQQLN